MSWSEAEWALVKRMDDKLDRLAAQIYGNGKPGLCQQIESILWRQRGVLVAGLILTAAFVFHVTSLELGVLLPATGLALTALVIVTRV